MARSFGVARLKFWEQDEPFLLNSPITYQGVTYVESVVDGSLNWTRLMSGVGHGSVAFYTPGTYWQGLAVPGRVCVAEQLGGHYANGARLLGCFVIEEIEPSVRDGKDVVELRGPGLESLLNKQLAWGQIGTAVLTNTNLAVAAAGPSARTLAHGYPPGVDHVVLNTSNSDDVKQEIRIALDGGGEHVTVITERELYNSEWIINLLDRLPRLASENNAVSIRTRRIRVDNAAVFNEGAQVQVTTTAGDFDTLATGETDDNNRVNLKDGLPAAANDNAAVAVTNISAPTTNDVAQIIGNAPGWVAYFQTGSGTAVGSAHQPRGESVFEMLSSLAERTGEFFRQRVITNPPAPTKSIDWRRTPDSSGVTLYMYDDADYAQQVADEMSLTKGAIFSLRHRRSLTLITRVFPAAGDQQIVLSQCSAGAIAYAAAQGCSIYSGVGYYEEDSVIHNAGIANYGYHEQRITYGDISISDAKDATALVAACDQLLISAVQTLVTAQEREYYTVDAYIPVAVLPGQTIKIVNQTAAGPQADGTENWIILEVTERFVGGRPRTMLTVSNMSGLRWTPANAFASRLRNVIQSQRRAAGGGGTTVIAGGGGGGTETTDHGLLTGLTDDDHPQYLLASGARALAGNLAVNAGITVDGVDISAHAANANAHHAAVTVQDASLSLTGQALRVADAFAGAGLSLTGGIATVNTATASGTTLSGDTVAVVPSSTGGVQLTAAGVALKTPANSGLQVDASGAALSPSTLSATTTNALSGAGHTHAVTATDNAKTTTGTLLKGSPAGDLTTRWLTADKLITPLVETAAGTLTLNPAAGKTINNGNLEFTGARSITTDTGSLTLAPAQTLVLDPADDVVRVNPTTTLRSSHAAVGVFPQTGWQIDYDGHGYFTSLLADELHVQSFIADIMRVKVGGEYIPESMALIRRDMTIPAVGATATLYVEDIPGWGNIAAFAENDWVLLRIVSRAGGGLIVASAWGQVTGYNDLPDGEQSWTFTTRVATTAVGQRAMTGDIALDYGKVGSSWWYVTVLDPGGPHAGFASWYGSYPGDNPEYWLRMGQLRGLSGTYERGFQTGKSTSSFTRFSELRNEIHGSRLSLYAGDGGRMQVSAVEVVFYRTGSQSSTLVPNGDGTAVNVETTAGNYWSAVDEGTGAPNHGDYITNRANLSGSVFLSLTNPASFSSIFRVDIKAALKTTGLANDTVHIFGQVFADDEATPLTGEVLLVTRTTNTTATVTVVTPHVGYGTGGAAVADWNGARLRLRWEYDINANEEAIRLDPGVPSLAVGNPLPTGMTTGGPGLWAGLESGAYQARIGDALGARLNYDGNGLHLVSGSTGAQIVLDPTAQSIALGNPLPTGVETGGAGLWVGLETGAYRFRLGAVGGTALRYDGANLFLRNGLGAKVIELNGSGDSYFAGLMTIDPAGAIVQGTGSKGLMSSWASPWGTFTGLRIGNDSGVGRLVTYNAGTPQVTLDTTGALTAGGATVKMNATGLRITTPVDWGNNLPSTLSFLTPSGLNQAFIDTRYSGTNPKYSDMRLGVLKAYTGAIDPDSFLYFQVYDFAGTTEKRITISAGVTTLTLNDSIAYGVGVSIDQDLSAPNISAGENIRADNGVSAGFTGSMQPGQIVSNLNGTDNNALVLQDTVDVIHGMTSVVATNTYGAFGKEVNDDGGLKIIGMSQGVIGTRLYGYGTGESTTSTTAARGAVVLSGRKASGTGSIAISNTGNVLTVDNDGTTRLVLKGNGDLLIDGSQSSYDSYDDVALLRAADLAQAGRDIDVAYDDWLVYNRADLEAAGLLDGSFVNVTRMQRLITGAIWQLSERIRHMEKNYGRGTA